MSGGHEAACTVIAAAPPVAAVLQADMPSVVVAALGAPALHSELLACRALPFVAEVSVQMFSTTFTYTVPLPSKRGTGRRRWPAFLSTLCVCLRWLEQTVQPAPCSLGTAVEMPEVT